jgi:hypothetical protein
MILFLLFYLLVGLFLTLDFPCKKDHWIGVILFVLFYPVIIILGAISLYQAERFRFLRRPKK